MTRNLARFTGNFFVTFPISVVWLSSQRTFYNDLHGQYLMKWLMRHYYRCYTDMIRDHFLDQSKQIIWPTTKFVNFNLRNLFSSVCCCYFFFASIRFPVCVCVKSLTRVPFVISKTLFFCQEKKWNITTTSRV